VTSGLGDVLTSVDTVSVSASSTSRWFRIHPMLTLAGIATGLAGALALLAGSPGRRGKIFGRIALGALLLSILGPGLLGIAFPVAAFGVKVTAIIAGFGFGAAGRDSKEGRWALIGAWTLLFMWGAPLAAMQKSLFPDEGSGWVPVRVTANPGTAPVAAVASEMQAPDRSPPLEGIAEPWLQRID